MCIRKKLIRKIVILKCKCSIGIEKKKKKKMIDNREVGRDRSKVLIDGMYDKI